MSPTHADVVETAVLREAPARADGGVSGGADRPPPSRWVPTAILKRRSGYWVAGAAILVLDIWSGPDLMFPILFVLPVAVSAWHVSARFAFLLAFGLSACRTGIAIGTEHAPGVLIHVANGLIRFVVLGLLAFFVSRTADQRRKIRVLEGLLPICMHCKRIRGKGDAWEQLEVFLSQHSAAEFSHGICPACLAQHYDAEDDARPHP